MAMSFGRFLARNILTLTKSSPLPLCRIHAVNRFIDNPLKAAAIGIRFRSTGASSKAKTTTTTAGAKRTVKKKKPITARKTAAKTTSRAGRTVTKAKSTATKKKPASKKPAAKKKLAAKKKPAAKKKKKKDDKDLTPKQLVRRKKRSLRARVLEAPKVPAANPYSTFVALGGGSVGTEAAEKWKALTPQQQQEYAEKARDLRKAGIRNREQWVKSQDPQEVYKANRARKHLRRLGGKVSVLKDPRIPKRPAPVCAAFLRDQWNAGTFTNPDGTKMDIITAIRHSRDLYEKLSAAQKKAYEDQYAVDRVAYKKAMDELLGDLKKL